MSNTFLISFILCIFSPSAISREANVLFSNGDSINVTVLKVGVEQCQFSHPAFKEDFFFKTKTIQHIQYKEATELAAQSNCNITLNKRSDHNLPLDFLKGSLKNISQESVSIDTAFAGQLEIHKKFIESLDLFNSKFHIIPSVGTLANWKKSESPPSVIEQSKAIVFQPIKNQNAYSRMGRYIYREVDFPQKFKLHVEIEKKQQKRKSNNGGIRLTIFGTEKGEHYGGSNETYYLEVFPNIIYFKRSKKMPNNHRNKTESLINFPIPNEFSNQATLSITALVNTEKKLFTILYNGKSIIDLDIPDLESDKLGQTIAVGAYSSHSHFSLKKLSLIHWDGFSSNIQHRSRISPTSKTPEHYKLIELQNGDSIDGVIKSIAKGEAKLETKYGNFRVKLENIKNLNIDRALNEDIYMSSKDARFKFSDGSTLIAELIDISGTTITAASQVFSENINFDIKHIKSIEFQEKIYPF